MKKFAMFAAGVLFGTTGIKVLGSKDTKKAYGHFFHAFFIVAVTVRSAGGQGIRPHKACRAAGLTHGIVRMTQSQRQVVRSQFLHQCADAVPGEPPFIAAAVRVFVKVRQPFHVRPFWHGQDECAKQGTVDDIHLKAVRCQLPPSRYPRTHGAVSSPEILL